MNHLRIRANQASTATFFTIIVYTRFGLAVTLRDLGENLTVHSIVVYLTGEDGVAIETFAFCFNEDRTDLLPLRVFDNWRDITINELFNLVPIVNHHFEHRTLGYNFNWF